MPVSQICSWLSRSARPVKVADLLLGRVFVTGEGRLCYARRVRRKFLPGAAARAGLQLVVELW